ncbi:MAG: hypothetical protein JSW66_19840 [Phycisphaerales bacterium]|nr:MAG: hypothetical protein JSW66_19840 [Phycisphaerales bacterium]
MARIAFLVGSLLLVLAAGCSLEKCTVHDSEHKQFHEAHEAAVGEHLAEEASGHEAEKEVWVANDFCIACHYGFDEEKLAARHKQAGIGCERCHGESERHRSDEDNVTPPEIMYPRDKINPTCMMCHPRHEIQHVAHHEKLLAGARTALDSTSQSHGHGLYCTSCHAKEHRINVRTIRWNKATGELLDE